MCVAGCVRCTAACHAKRRQVPSSWTEIVKIPASVGIARLKGRRRKIQ